MIKNTDLFYFKAKEYQDKRNELEDKYFQDMEKLKGHEGSEYYKEQSEQLKKKYDEDLTALKRTASKSLNTILSGMKEVIDRTQAKAPTEEQLRILETLKMRNKITKEDLDRAGESLKGCTLGLHVLNEIALEKGFMGYERYITEMSTARADSLCDYENIRDFIEHNTTRASRQVSASNKHKYGDAAITKYTRRTPFNDKESCFRDVMGIDGETLQRFCDLADGEGTGQDDK